MSPVSDYDEIRDVCLKSEKLWEDPDFQPSMDLIDEKHRDTVLEWLRPKEIMQRAGGGVPKFFVDGADRNDVDQGKLGDCWLVTAVSCLATAGQEKWFNMCIPSNQDFENDYAGIFRFRFWDYGKWIEVVVDDRLPTHNGKLFYGQNKTQTNEFWFPLFEKAYAKKQGSYDILAGGRTTDALVDFTGGISEKISMDEIEANLYVTFEKMLAKGSMITCSIMVPKEDVEHVRSTGLVAKHAYAINGVTQVEYGDGTVNLVRLRNPWGHTEWDGAWSDSSEEWKSVPDDVKKDIGLVVQDNGEFWMPMSAFQTQYSNVLMCHMSPEQLMDEVIQADKMSAWTVIQKPGQWTPGVNAGGPPGGDFFWRNPQVKFKSQLSKGVTTHTIVSLMQHSLNHKLNIAIGFNLYKVINDTIPTRERYHKDQLKLVAGVKPSKYREVTTRIVTRPGRYVIIPFTKEQGMKAKFLVRIFTETPAS
jgi:calpain